MAQIDSFNELRKEQRPPEYMWDNPEELDEWFDKIFGRKKEESTPGTFNLLIPESEIEG